MRNAHKILVEKPEWERPFGRSRHRWEDNINMDLTGVGYVYWIRLAQDVVQWQALLNMIMNTRYPLFIIMYSSFAPHGA
jgi:hypothetical protein